MNKSYLKYSFSIFVLLVAGCTQHQVRETASEKKFRVFDAHAHFDSDKSLKQPSDALKNELEQAGVEAVVIHLETKSKLEINFPKNLRVAMCAGLVFQGESINVVEKKLKEGTYRCLKIYLGYVPKYATDPYYKPFYKLAQKYNVPVVFHTGDTLDKMALIKYADPLQLDEIAVTYPKVNFVMAHLGNPWFDSAAQVLYKNDNMYADLSGLLLGDVSKESPEAINELVLKTVKWVYLYVDNPKKFLFGSDWPVTNIKPYIEVMKKAIPEKDWEGFFYWNAMEVFFKEKRPTAFQK